MRRDELVDGAWYLIKCINSNYTFSRYSVEDDKFVDADGDYISRYNQTDEWARINPEEIFNGFNLNMKKTCEVSLVGKPFTNPFMDNCENKDVTDVKNKENNNIDERMCSIHRDRKSVFFVQGDIDCYYCGNEVCMCQECVENLKKEVADVK